VTETVYFAAPFNKILTMRDYRWQIQKHDWEVTSGWINNEPGTKATGTTELTPPDFGAPQGEWDMYWATVSEAIKAATDNMSDLFHARTIILFTKYPSTSGGYHTELGLALATSKRVIIIGPRQNVFQALPSIEQHDTFDAFLKTLEPS
jgi:hypothetical protein